MILRGVIQAVRVSTRNQVFVDVETFANSINKNVPLFAQFGIASVPKVGTRCICLCLNGDYESLIAIAAQSMTRDGELSEGQTQLGTDDATIKVTDAVDIVSSGFTVSSNEEELISILDDLLTGLKTFIRPDTSSSFTQIVQVATDVQDRLDTFRGE